MTLRTPARFCPNRDHHMPLDPIWSGGVIVARWCRDCEDGYPDMQYVLGAGNAPPLSTTVDTWNRILDDTGEPGLSRVGMLLFVIIVASTMLMLVR